jgi:MFS family permease
MVTGYTIINELYDDHRSVKILAIMGSTAVIAPMIGPVFGGYLLLFTGWRTTFWAVFALAALGLVGLYRFMPESLKSPDLEGMRLKKLKTVYFKIISSPAFLTSASTFGFMYAGMIIWTTASPYLIIFRLGHTPKLFGWSQVPIYGAYILGTLFVRALLKSASLNRLVVVGLTICAGSGAALLLTALILPMDVMTLVIPMACYGFGFGLTSAPLMRSTIKALEHTDLARNRGAATALFYLWMICIGVVGSALSSLFCNVTLFTLSLICFIALLAPLLNQMRLRALSSL